MNPRLIELYNDELLHLRSEGAEFAREYPERAGRLGLDDSRVEDPYVERLLEGVAFLAARVRLKLDSQFPVFTQQLLDVLFPGWLDPSPSACVLQVRPDPARSELAGGSVMPRGSVVRASLRGRAALRCEFETCRDLQLLPLEITAARYQSVRQAAVEGYPGATRAASSLQVDLALLGEGRLAELPLERLPLFVTAADAHGTRLMELLGGRCLAVGLSAPGARRMHAWLPADAVRHIGFDADEALFRPGNRGHAGFRVLKEYAAFPDKFRFVEVGGLRAALAGFTGTRAVLHFFFSGSFAALESAVDGSSLALFCVPAVNLRERSLDRIELSPAQTEYHLVADRMRPTQQEVIQVLEVTGGGAGAERRFRPLFEAVASGGPQATAFHVLRREQRRLSRREAGTTASSSYVGTETYLSVSEPATPPYGKDLQHLSVRALCSDRDVPLYLKAQFGSVRYEPLQGIPARQVDCIAGPSAPQCPPMDGFDPWVALSHLSVNHLYLVDQPASSAVDALRRMLALYARVPSHFLHRQAEGLTAVQAEQVTRRVPGAGPLAFGRGVCVTLGMSDQAFDGGSPFLLAAVLEHYLAAHVSLNSFIQARLRLDDRSEQLAWPPRFGRRPTF